VFVAPAGHIRLAGCLTAIRRAINMATAPTEKLPFPGEKYQQAFKPRGILNPKMVAAALWACLTCPVFLYQP